MNNISSYCGLTDARMRDSEKDLTVPGKSILPYLNFTRRSVARSTWSAGSRNRAMVQVHHTMIDDQTAKKHPKKSPSLALRKIGKLFTGK